MPEETKENLKEEIINALKSGHFEDVTAPGTLLNIGKISTSDYNEILGKGKEYLDNYLTPKLYDIKIAYSIKEFLDLDEEETSALVIKRFTKLLEVDEIDKAFQIIEIFNNDENNLAIHATINALNNKKIEMALKLIYTYKINNYIDPDKKFNITGTIKSYIYEIKKLLFDFYEILRQENEYRLAAELTNFLANKKIYQIELIGDALNNGFFTEAKNLVDDYKVFEDEVNQPDNVIEKLDELRNIKRKHYNIQKKNKRYDLALMIAEIDPDTGRDNVILINETANLYLEDLLKDLQKLVKAKAEKSVIEGRLKQIHLSIKKYDVFENIYNDYGAQYFNELLNHNLLEEAEFFYKNVIEKYNTAINKELWGSLFKKINDTVEKKLLTIIDNKSVSDLKDFVTRFQYKIEEGTETHKEVDNRIREIFRRSIENNYEKNLYIKGAKILLVLDIKPSAKTRKVAEQIFIEVLDKSKIDISEAQKEGKKYQKYHAENFKDIYLLGKSFKVKGYEDALINAFIIYSKLLEFHELNKLYANNINEFKDEKTKASLINFMQKEKKEWKNNEEAVAEFNKAGKKFFGEQFSQKQKGAGIEDYQNHKGILYNIFIAPWVYIFKAIYHMLFKRFLEK